jgi:hypothetical protein
MYVDDLMGGGSSVAYGRMNAMNVGCTSPYLSLRAAHGTYTPARHQLPLINDHCTSETEALLVCLAERQFQGRLLKAPPLSQLPLGPCKLYVHEQSLCITTDAPPPPPRILAAWDVQDFRRFGLIEDNFCFEVGDGT